ncbi:MAG TPA: hypothetical protein VEU55_03475 [Gemmatimonadales bacterium]|nr:hypothetical protein [Gemmatimonadales bacterium]
MKRVWRDECGMALGLAMLALVVVGALVAGAFFSGTQEQRAADNSRRILQAFGVAEEGAYEVIATWKPLLNDTLSTYPANSLSVGGWPSYWTTAANMTGVYGGYVYHLNHELYLVDMTARDSASVGDTALTLRGGGGRARLGLLVRNRPLQVGIRGALTTGDGSNISGTTTISGLDQSPTGWANCGPAAPAIAGVRAAKGDTVTRSGAAVITGNPPIMVDTSVHASTFDQFGSVSYAQLAATATITLPGQNFATGIAPAVTNGVCDQTVTTNWGDPLNPTAPCGSYWPIIHVTGDATINGQEGQGILLVDGNLAVQGGFQFYGITIVKGSLVTAGGGTSPAHFWGATLVQDSVTLGAINTVTGSANLLYSNCAITRALEMTAVPTLMRSRSWVPLF